LLPVLGDMQKSSFFLASVIGLLFLALPGLAEPSKYIRSQAERDAMTPNQVLDSIKAGNQRFVKGELTPRNFRNEQMATKGGQHPSAVILSCIDSRAPAEIIFDKGIGEIFNARIAGNVANFDILGSMEFACAVAGAKVVMVVGHTRCGAVNGAIDDVELGNLTGLLQRIHPAVDACKTHQPGPYKASNEEFQKAVTRKNVQLTVEKIRRDSPTLRELEKKGQIVIQGTLYNVATGEVEFL
jgi:carbonic anhydrase